ncbi:Uncharacterized protein TPAR_03716 [Tolypocladium paradoxum]|uniref:Uncharacterized protein n=1 Tax=Tolypocladium paradoxum TaxID=94208 RepID=A0A2S4L0W8_9HYPO|nr:Uncharacterized protein TPAR_03716 [Tolypocladium paradoxum]
MSLHRLPPEILLHILRLLGSSFFRQDVRRLLVCRWWCRLARPVLLQDLDLTATSLEAMVNASGRRGMVDSIKNHVKTVSIGFDGFEDWPSAQTGSEHAEIDFRVVTMWTYHLNVSLDSLGRTLRQCTKLQSLRLEARPELHDPQLGLQERDYLLGRGLVSLLSLSHLTCLEFDTAGTSLVDATTYLHLCHEIHSRLPTLRRLRCRMRRLCPHLLDPPPVSAPTLGLEDLIVNLSLSETSSSDTSYRYPICCRLGPVSLRKGFPRLQADMELKARELVRVMKNPRIVRVVSHTFPSLEMRSFDALTGRRMRLPPAAAWDADGEEVEEESVQDQTGIFDSDDSSTTSEESLL